MYVWMDGRMYMNMYICVYVYVYIYMYHGLFEIMGPVHPSSHARSCVKGESCQRFVGALA